MTTATITAAEARALIAKSETERSWQRSVVTLAASLGYRTYHTHDSRRSNPGFPDLALCRVPHLVFFECKTHRGRATREQIEWLEVLAASGHVAAVVRPDDFKLVHMTLLDPARVGMRKNERGEPALEWRG